jgi:hypothetical protein
VVDVASRDVVERVAKALYYPDRTWPRILAGAVEAGASAARIQALQRWLPAGRVDRKRQDALAMLAAMRDVLAGGQAGCPAAFTIAPSAHWDRARRAMKRSTLIPDTT